MILRLLKDMFLNKEQGKKKHIYIQCDLLNRFPVGGTTHQFGTNTCHHNNKFDQILNYLHLF